uniref:Uncharacterized protein n=1 Tax=Rhizophora mucronata TaxID=61149 RepID=A0A2P2NM62_RHIMU
MQTQLQYHLPLGHLLFDQPQQELLESMYHFALESTSVTLHLTQPPL